MTSSSLDSQLGLAAESTYATYVAPTRFWEYTKESLKFDRDRIETKAIRAGRRVMHRWAAGVQRVTGSTEHELAPQGVGLLFEHAFGGKVTSGVGPYTHTFTPGALDAKSATVQVTRPSIDGTARVFSYLGMKVDGWEINAKVNEYVEMKLDWYGAAEDTAQSAAAVSYPSGFSPFVFTHGSLTVAGSAIDVHEIKLKGDNNLKKNRHFIRATTPEQPKIALEADRRSYTGEFKGDFESLTQYNRYVNGTEAALVLAFNAGASAQLTITCNVRFDGETPNIDKIDLLDFKAPFVCTSGTSDAAAITAVLINGDATA